MANGVPQDKPTFLVRSWKVLVLKAFGPDYNRSDECYEFSNGRKFESSDRGDSGVYEKD